jgi:hypothetical protein
LPLDEDDDPGEDRPADRTLIIVAAVFWWLVIDRAVLLWTLGA